MGTIKSIRSRSPAMKGTYNKPPIYFKECFSTRPQGHYTFKT